MTLTITHLVHDSDLLQHIEDSHLYHIFRHGRPLRCTWNDLTVKERELLRQAQRRATYVEEFHIYG